MSVRPFRPARTLSGRGLPARSLRTFGLAIALVLPALLPAHAARVNSTGLVDYSRKNFKLGDWVRYRVEVSTSRGIENVSYQEIRIVGEEEFRGEKCFWIETRFGPDSSRVTQDLVLVSYDVFQDKDADVMFSLYTRMMMFSTDDEGVPDMQEVRKATAAAKRPDLTMMRGKVDTLGTETVETERGPIEARLLKAIRKLGNPKQSPDSTTNLITFMDRKQWMSNRVPITSLVKEEEFFERRIQTYAVGTPSTEAPETVLDNEVRSALVVAWGTGARSPMLELWQKKKALLRAPDLEGGAGP